MTKFIEVHDTDKDEKKLINTDFIVLLEDNEQYADICIIAIQIGSKVIPMNVKGSYTDLMMQITNIDN